MVLCSINYRANCKSLAVSPSTSEKLENTVLYFFKVKKSKKSKKSKKKVLFSFPGALAHKGDQEKKKTMS
jgi:hypothetical protein